MPDTTPTKHALLSPSKMGRILRCPGSVALCLDVPEPPTSNYAEAGTAAHELAAAVLTASPLPTKALSAELNDAAMQYVAAIRALAPPLLRVEQPVNLEPITGEPDAAGTPDAVLWWPETRHLEVWDLKTGRGILVSPQNNAQLMTYALAQTMSVETITLVIHQPLVDPEPQRWDVPKEALAAFARELVTACATATDLLTTDPADILLHLNPSEEACRWCPAKSAGVCPALEAEVLGLMEVQPDTALGVQDVNALKPLVFERALEACELAELYANALKERVNAIRTEAAAQLASGHEIAGWKLVAGRRGARAWGDPAATEAALKAMRLSPKVMYEKKLVSPTTAEKRLGPRRWAKMQEYITQADGKAVVVRESDKRPALLTVQESDFENLSTTD